MAYNNAMNKILQKIRIPLFDWFDRIRRDLPWRVNRTPYRVWISEIMLQQTQVITVIDYFNHWLSKWPDIESLAQASEDEVLKAWEGLGYYSRARNILKTAKLVYQSDSKELPTSYAELIKLPGIGSYTAAAIASYTAKEKVAAIDANVLRVTSRLLAKDWTAGDIKSIRECKNLHEETMNFFPDSFHPGKWNEALIELGALCCQAKQTSCSQCPLSSNCLAFQKDLIYSYPLPKTKLVNKEEDYTVLIIEERNKYAVVQRPSNGLLANLWQFPMLEGHLEQFEVEDYLSPKYHLKSIVSLKDRKHVFSHLTWRLKIYYIAVDRKSSVDNLILSESNNEESLWEFQDAASLETLAFSSSMAPLRAFILENEDVL